MGKAVFEGNSRQLFGRDGELGQIGRIILKDDHVGHWAGVRDGHPAYADGVSSQNWVWGLGGKCEHVAQEFVCKPSVELQVCDHVGLVNRLGAARGGYAVGGRRFRVIYNIRTSRVRNGDPESWTDRDS